MRLFVLLCLSCACAVVTGASAETLVVPATSVAGVWSSPLTAGCTYEFTAYGVYDYSYNRWAADPEWIFFYPDSPTEYWTYGIVDGGPFGESNDILDLIINDGSVSWLGSTDGVTWAPHVYSRDTHTYKYYFTATGQSVNFRIADLAPFGGDALGDNQGYLTVEIKQLPVPEPSSLLALLSGIGGMIWRRKRNN